MAILRAEKRECLFLLSKKLFFTFFSIYAIHIADGANGRFLQAARLVRKGRQRGAVLTGSAAEKLAGFKSLPGFVGVMLAGCTHDVARSRRSLLAAAARMFRPARNAFNALFLKGK